METPGRPADRRCPDTIRDPKASSPKINYRDGGSRLRVQAEVAVGNIASRAVLQRAGFQPEVTLRSGQLLTGQPHDSQVWSRLHGNPAIP